MIGKKLIRLASETNSQMFQTTLEGAASWSDDANLPARFAAWQNTGFDGLAVSIASNAPSKGFTAMGQQWWNVRVQRSYSEFTDEIATLNAQNWGRLTDNFLHSSMAPWDTPGTVTNQGWFNNAHWATLTNNVAIQARVANELGFKGVVLDTEQYDHHGADPWYHPFSYNEYVNGGCQCPLGQPRTFNEASQKVFERGQEYAQALNSEFPGITLMMIPAINRPNGLLIDESLYQFFFDGIVSGLDANSKLIAGSEFTYGLSDYADFVDGRDDTLAQYLARSTVDQDILDKWSFTVGVFADHPNGGVWSTTDPSVNFRDPQRHEYATRNALAASDEYAWSYGEQSQFLEDTPTPVIEQYLDAHEDARAPVPSSGFFETFDDGFHEPGSSFTSGTFPTGVGTEVSLVNDAVEFTNFPVTDGTYRADAPLAADAIYDVNLRMRINPGAITQNAYLLNVRAGDPNTEADLLLKAVQNPDGSNSTSTWDIEVTDANGVTSAGIALRRGLFHDITMRHTGNGADEIELLVNGILVGTYVDRAAAFDVASLFAGNPSSATGFGSATLDAFSIQVTVIPEPATIVLLLTILPIRRRGPRRA